MRSRASAVVAVLLIACGRPAEQRARTYFAIPDGTPVDSTTIRNAFLRLIPIGTSEPEVARTLAERGIGKDSLSSYYPPDSAGGAIARIGFDHRVPQLVHRSFGIFLQFDSARALRSVRVEEWLTGS